MATTIAIEDTITVGDLAEKLSLPVTKLITELIKLGVMVTVNERIDFDTAQIIVQELELDISLEKEATEDFAAHKDKIEGHKKAPRPPIVAVMGHVDHGKTSLLDAIRGVDSTKGEAGGITQHLAAYQIQHNKRLITFLDTPGHEAFAALREHGSQLTDLVVLLVAADDGVKPQTIEAIRFARKSRVKIMVAINKIDKPEANINLVKQQLAEQDILVEGYGGDVVAVEVSAKTKKGIDELLDMILLIADVENLEAYTDVPGTGMIIESHMEVGRGPVAEALVEGGVLKTGDFIVAGTSYARIRNLESTLGESINEATASTPTRITGFKSLPNFGDEFNVVKDEKSARAQVSLKEKISQKGESRADLSGTEFLRRISRTTQVNEYKVIIKADVKGSIVSVVDSLKALETDEVAVRIVSSGVGAVNENDIHLAQTGGAVIYGFNVTVPKNIDQLARRYSVNLRLYKVIYELIDDVRQELSQRLAPEIVIKELGVVQVKGIFKITKNAIICGGEVTKGKLSLPSLARIVRDKKVIAEAEVTNLKRGPQDVKEVLEGEMCGLSLKTEAKVDLQLEDKIELFNSEEVERNI